MVSGRSTQNSEVSKPTRRSRTARATPIDTYLSAVPVDRRKVLEDLRNKIRSVVPDAEECISYGIPAFRLDDEVVAGFQSTKKGASYYPFSGSTLATVARFTRGYAQTKSALHFLLEDPLPLSLVKTLVRARLDEIRKAPSNRSQRIDELATGRWKKRLAKPRSVGKKARSAVKAVHPILPQTLQYNELQEAAHRVLCDVLANEINKVLTEADNKIWHAHPVWFLDDNPIVGYSKQKPGIRLMFWSGADFDEAGLKVVGKKFKDASVFYNDASEVKLKDLRRWLRKAREIQWDYKNLVRRKGRFERLK